jgi:hypothetical protein
MKLTTAQIETIEHHLLDWGLEYQDFYDEVLDHFILKTEGMLSEEVSFENAFKMAQKDFSGKKFKEHRGLKAFEMEYANNIKLELKKAIRGKMKEQFLSSRILVWVFLGACMYQFYLTQKEAFLIPVAILFGIFFLTPLFLIPWRYQFDKQAKWLVNDHWALKKRKRKLLYEKAKTRLMMSSTISYFIVINFVFQCSRILMESKNTLENNPDQSFPLWYQVFLFIGGLGLISVIWAQSELALEEKQKTNN